MTLEDFKYEFWFKVPRDLDKDHRVEIAWLLHEHYLRTRDAIVEVLKDAGYDPHWIDQSEPLEPIIAGSN